MSTHNIIIITIQYGHTALNWAILRGNTEAAETILLLSDAAGIIEDNKVSSVIDYESSSCNYCACVVIII